jgi:hypothetical protein
VVEAINLNRARKARAQAQAKATAAQNRVRFVQSKAERTARRAEDVKAGRDLDGHKRD